MCASSILTFQISRIETYLLSSLQKEISIERTLSFLESLQTVKLRENSKIEFRHSFFELEIIWATKCFLEKKHPFGLQQQKNVL